MENYVVRKLDENGRFVWEYPARVLSRGENEIRLEAFFNREDMDLGYTTFKRGDRFVEYFYSDRFYNIFAIYDRDNGELKGWYCNICRPAVIGETAVLCEDLALDLWVLPDGETLLLDEDQFDALKISEEERRQGQIGCGQIESLALMGQLPK